MKHLIHRLIYIPIILTAIALALSTTLAGKAYASADDNRGDTSGLDAIIKDQSKELNLDELESSLGDAAELLDGEGVLSDKDAQSRLGSIISKAWGQASETVTSTLRNAAIILMAAVFAGIFSSAFTDKKYNYATLAGVLAITIVSLSSVNTFIGMSATVLQDLSDFSKMLLPTLTATATASGNAASSSAKYAVTVLFIDILLTSMKTVILPLIFSYCAVSVAEAAVGGDTLAGVSNLLKWMIKTALTAFVLVFVVYITVSGVIASAGDAAAVKTTKVVISSLPVVGGILADAANAVLSGASVLRGAVGVFGVLAVVAICAVPFIKLGINYLLFKFAGGVAATVADARISKLIGAFGTAFGMAMATAGACAVMLFISIISVISVIG